MPRHLATLALSVSLLLAGCGYYSFSGASIPEHLGRIAIPLAEDQSLATVPTLDERLTDLLLERFVQQTRLALEPDEDTADVLLEARITGFRNTPTAVSGAEVAERNRVELTVSIRYQDRIEDRVLLDRAFTAFAEYDPIVDGTDGEEIAARAALEQIADDVFTAATSNW